MNRSARFALALACVPAWLVGVLTTGVVILIPIVGVVSGDARPSILTWASLLLVMGMLFTVPALLASAVAACLLAPRVARRPIAFGLLAGLGGSAPFLMRASTARDMADVLLIAGPGTVAATALFRYLVRRQRCGAG